MKLGFVQRLVYSRDAHDPHKSFVGHKRGELQYYGSAVRLTFGDFFERLR